MIAERIEGAKRVDWWSLTRVAITAVVLAAAAHVLIGWQPPLRHLLGMPVRMIGIMSLLAMVSFALADLYLLAFLVALLVVGILNDWLYAASRCVFVWVFRPRSASIIALGGLCGEIIMFGCLAWAIRAALSRL